MEKCTWRGEFTPVVIHTHGCSIPQEGEVILVASCEEYGVNTGHCSAVAEFDAAVSRKALEARHSVDIPLITEGLAAELLCRPTPRTEVDLTNTIRSSSTSSTKLRLVCTRFWASNLEVIQAVTPCGAPKLHRNLMQWPSSIRCIDSRYDAIIWKL